MDLTKCFTLEQQRLSGSQLEMILFKILFPPICLFGIIGNLLNIMVFFSTAMKSRAKSLLASLAICDITFLLLMVPHSLANFESFAYSFYFRWYYLIAKIHLITFANWCSAIAIWIMIAVCAERVMGIRDPFGSGTRWSRACIIVYVILIVALAGCLTFYNHFSYLCFVNEYCNRTQVMARCFDVTRDSWSGNYVNRTPLFLRNYIKWSIVANALFVVIIPIILLTALNVALIVYIRNRSFVVYQKFSDSRSRTLSEQEKRRRSSQCDSLFRFRAEQALVQKTEYRIAVTVCAIVTSFTITQGPSAIVLSLSSLMSRRVPDVRNHMDLVWHQFHTIASFLVVVGKALNFVLFCLSSCSFRSYLVQLLRNFVTRTSNFNNNNNNNSSNFAYNRSKYIENAPESVVSTSST